MEQKLEIGKDKRRGEEKPSSKLKLLITTVLYILLACLKVGLTIPGLRCAFGERIIIIYGDFLYTDVFS